MINNMLTFDREFNQLGATIEDITMISSSSAGNSLYIKPYDVLIDMGVPFSKYDPEIFYNLKYVLLTHEHGDHFIPATINAVTNRFPHITFLISQHLLEVGREKFKKAGKTLDERRMQVLDDEPIIYETSAGDTAVIYHTVTDHGDIPNVSYTIKGTTKIDKYDMPVILYASDLRTTSPSEIGQGLPMDEEYNLMFLEANYDKEELFKALYADPANKLHLDMHKRAQEDDAQFTYSQTDLIEDLSRNVDNHRILGNFRHLSEDESFSYVRKHLANDGTFIPLHGSSDYGSFLQIARRKDFEK